MIYLLALALVLVGLYGVVTKKNAVKIVLALVVVEYAINLFWILLGYRAGGVPPVTVPGAPALPAAGMVDPFPQSVVLCTIVVGLGVLALLLGLCLRLYERHGTFDVTEMKDLKG